MVKLIITADYTLPEGERVSLEIDKNNPTKAEELFLDTLIDDLADAVHKNPILGKQNENN